MVPRIRWNSARPTLPVLVGVVGLAWPCFAAHGAGLEATVDRNECTMQDRIVLKVKVEGSRSATPTLPPLPDFDVYSRGSSQQFSMVNGRTSISVEYNYILVPKRQGRLTIGPASVTIDGKTYRSRPIPIQVLAAGARPTESGLFFATAKVSNERPYVGEQVVYTLRLFERVGIRGARIQSMNFDGFISEDLGEQRSYETVLKGQRYAVSEIRKALFPQETGSATIPAAALEVDVPVRQRGRRGWDPFGGILGGGRVQTQIVTTKSIDMEIRPLPAAPAGFTGLVGNFKLVGQVSKTQLATGESTTLTVTISGVGNAQNINEPKMPDLQRFKVYDDKPKSSINTKGVAIQGSKTFRKSLVPLQAGNYAIPGIRLVFFEPKSGSYQTAVAGPFPLRVTPGKNKEELRLTELIAPSTGQVGVKMGVKVLADDILPIYNKLDALRHDPIRPRTFAGWGGAALTAPLMFFGLLVVRRRSEREAQDTALRRRRQALGKFKGALKKMEESAKSSDIPALAQIASRSLREYLGDKLNMEGRAFTPTEAADRLEKRGLPAALVHEVESMLRQCDAAQYGGGRDPQMWRQTPEQLRALVQRLDKTL